ncbi:MAG: enoyl-CoA hydratase/isomerase family protein [Chloroflexi bacterium]|nr:enoyl-CoA hydratase/isomerase family protein [Chloroflexota bacterium]
MPHATLLYSTEGHVARITLDRPDRLNALNNTLWKELREALEQAEKDDEVRIVVLKGAGPSFCAGEDLGAEETGEVSPWDPRRRSYLADLIGIEERRMNFWRYLFNYPKDTVAQVHGYCLGFGCNLQMCCGTTIAAEDALFGDPGVRMGLATSMPLWSWRVGPRRAKDLLLTGRYIDAREAERIGLVTQVVAPGEIEGVVDVWCKALLTVGGLGSVEGRLGGLGGSDGSAGWMGTSRQALEASGLAEAWRLAAYMRYLSTIQRRGFAPGEFNFWQARDAKGVRAALRQRDAPYRPYFPLGLKD